MNCWNREYAETDDGVSGVFAETPAFFLRRLMVTAVTDGTVAGGGIAAAAAAAAAASSAVSTIVLRLSDAVAADGVDMAAFGGDDVGNIFFCFPARFLFSAAQI
jgi:hypothetical protein